ncbi:MAG: MBOAT family O-acyltransferase, partial [Halioglobus sp.]|nr:MBOAT family O-acyltransferase [Halioglobus sp.]
GAALMFNIHLPLNFNSPYKAMNIQDFWRRWHMTLSRWLRDYLYIPLGGNRRGVGRTYVNLFATFLLGGLWHGAGWTFVIWGAMHGAALALHRYWSSSGRRMHAALAWPLTFVFVTFAWVMFRAEDLGIATRIMAGMLGLNGFGFSDHYRENFSYYLELLRQGSTVQVSELLGPVGTMLFLCVFGIIAFVGRNSIEIAMEKVRFGVLDVARVSVSFFLVILLSIASTSSVFLYFNF